MLADREFLGLLRTAQAEIEEKILTFMRGSIGKYCQQYSATYCEKRYTCLGGTFNPHQADFTQLRTSCNLLWVASASAASTEVLLSPKNFPKQSGRVNGR